MSSRRARAIIPARGKAALFQDDVPVAVYDNLIASVRANLEPLFRYYELRRRVLRLDEIHAIRHLCADRARTSRRMLLLMKPCEKVLTALAPLGAEYGRILGEGLRGARWCDRYENKGKRCGAFFFEFIRQSALHHDELQGGRLFRCLHARARSRALDAHLVCAAPQPFQTYDYPIFLAEVASTFNEELLTHHLLEHTDDQKMRAYLINRQIDDIRGTVYRQTMFAEFEKIIARHGGSG